MSWLGRGFEDVPGKPFGWAWHQERDEIRAHLRRRIWKFGLDGLAAMRLESRIDRIQARLHRHRPSYKERQAAWRARQRPADPPRPEPFTAEELAHIAEHFEGANDPLAQSIWRKAAGR